MQITRIVDAQPYDAPGHHGMVALRLQGHSATATEANRTNAPATVLVLMPYPQAAG